MNQIIIMLLLLSSVLFSTDRYLLLHTSARVDTYNIADVDSMTFLKDPDTTWQPGDTLIDARDGQKYATVVIGTQCWMAENLNVGVYKASVELIDSSHSDVSNNSIIEKYAYDNDTTKFATYGGLYDWNEAMDYSTVEGVQGVCPDGWHIPTNAEWVTLEMSLGMDSSDANNTGWRGTDQGTQLKDGGTSGFQALLSGYRHPEGVFGDMGAGAYFWSSSQYDASDAALRLIVSSRADVYNPQNYVKEWGFCIRCIKD